MTTHDPRTELVTVGARRVVLARYRTDAAGSAARPVHLIPLLRTTAGALGALCGTRQSAKQREAALNAVAQRGLRVPYGGG